MDLRIHSLNAPVIERARAAGGLIVHTRRPVAIAAAVGDQLVTDRIVESGRRLAVEDERAGNKARGACVIGIVGRGNEGGAAAALTIPERPTDYR